MNNVKMFYHKKDGNIGYHAIQSFKEGEVTPQIAHKIGIQLANELWGDRFQVIVTTHLNTNHIHNHFVINSVSFKDGMKYYDNHYTYAIVRSKSDELCAEYNLSIINEKTCKNTKINYGAFYNKYEEHNSYTKQSKLDVDFAIRQAYSYIDFFKLMNKLGYEIHERNERISIRYKDTNRNIRIERRFGENYTIENIKKRILTENAIRVPFIEEYNRKKISFTRPAKKKIKLASFIKIIFYIFRNK